VQGAGFNTRPICILSDAFDKRGIAELVRRKLGDRLDKLVDPDQPTPNIVFDLLTWIDKRIQADSMAMLEVFLQGAIEMKPKNAALRAFCERDVPGALKGIDPQVLAKAEMAEQRPKIFISYRREESKYQAKRLHDAL
jgi:hypothetical protein